MRSRDSDSPISGSRSRAGLIWFTAVLALAGVVWLLLVLTGVAGTDTSLIAVAWIALTLSLGVDARKRTMRRRRHRRRFPTLDALRRHVDTDTLRTVRDRHGQGQAVRHLRRQLPEVPLRDAVQLIKSL